MPRWTGDTFFTNPASDNHPSRVSFKQELYGFHLPHWQIVLTSTNPTELCINGMSFSRRASRWANAALVVTVSSKDFEAMQCHGPLAGVEFQVPFLSVVLGNAMSS